jgi:hypothetical protein
LAAACSNLETEVHDAEARAAERVPDRKCGADGSIAGGGLHKARWRAPSSSSKAGKNEVANSGDSDVGSQFGDAEMFEVKLVALLQVTIQRGAPEFNHQYLLVGILGFYILRHQQGLKPLEIVLLTRNIGELALDPAT